jgi:hypothetical protein
MIGLAGEAADGAFLMVGLHAAGIRAALQAREEAGVEHVFLFQCMISPSGKFWVSLSAQVGPQPPQHPQSSQFSGRCIGK